MFGFIPLVNALNEETWESTFNPESPTFNKIALFGVDGWMCSYLRRRRKKKLYSIRGCTINWNNWELQYSLVQLSNCKSYCVNICAACFRVNFIYTWADHDLMFSVAYSGSAHSKCGLVRTLLGRTQHGSVAFPKLE